MMEGDGERYGHRRVRMHMEREDKITKEIVLL